ncbi:MAG TPA: ROK family protein [Microlunatus sp.]
MTSVGHARSANRSAVLAVVLSARALDRNRIVEATGLSRATVFRIIDELKAQGIAVEVPLEALTGPGRPPTGIALNRAARRVCGVDLGGSNCRFAVADLAGRVLGRARQRTPRELEGAELADWIRARLAELLGSDMTDLAALAVGVPGALSGDAAEIVGSQNLPQIVGTGFIDALQNGVPAPVIIENDSNLALTGELAYGALDRNDTVSMLSIGTGLGTAAAIDGRLMRTKDGRLGEFGRLNLPGSKLKLRDLVSGAGLVAHAHETGLDLEDAQELFADPDRFPSLFRQVNDALVHLVAIVALAYEPSSILVTGGVSDGVDDDLLTRIGAEASDIVGVPVAVRRASLGDNAGLYGALSAALTSSYRDLGVATDQLAGIEVDRAAVRDSFGDAAATSIDPESRT